MKKIPTLFKRDFDNRGKITREYHEDVAWVLAGEGVATRKYDGTAALVRDGMLWKRYTLKPGKTAPTTFEGVDTDPETGKTVGWVIVGPEDKWHIDALQEYPLHALPDGTYELIGPKVQGNPENTALHELVAHDPNADPKHNFGTLATVQTYDHVPTAFDDLRDWLDGRDIEGIVWQHPEGRMAKIKLEDYDLKRNGA